MHWADSLAWRVFALWLGNCWKDSSKFITHRLITNAISTAQFTKFSMNCEGEADFVLINQQLSEARAAAIINSCSSINWPFRCDFNLAVSLAFVTLYFGPWISISIVAVQLPWLSMPELLLVFLSRLLISVDLSRSLSLSFDVSWVYTSIHMCPFVGRS